MRAEESSIHTGPPNELSLEISESTEEPMDEGRLGLIDGDAPLGLSGSGVCIRCGAAAVMQLCEALPEALWYRYR